MNQYVPGIEYGKIPKVLLLGNGINRAYGYASWSELIDTISTIKLTEKEKQDVKKIPCPLQPVVMTGDHLGTQMKHISAQLAEMSAPEQEETVLRAFAALPVDSILTANYTYELEKALKPDFRCVPGRKCEYRKLVCSNNGQYNAQQLHSCFVIGDYPPVWHIHGEAAKHNTMVLGHYYYGKLLSKMQQYVASLMARYRARTSRSLGLEIRSWLDYFLLGDVYIVGLGMDLSELDLWWLVNCKKRHFPDRTVTLYKPDINSEDKLLAEAYGVHVNAEGYNGDYKAYYQWVYEELKEKLCT